MSDKIQLDIEVKDNTLIFNTSNPAIVSVHAQVVAIDPEDSSKLTWVMVNQDFTVNMPRPAEHIRMLL